jgi:1-acyl-sn-glycerol-3-phosphate acyltransferase
MSASEFPKPYPVQFSGNRLARWLVRRLGWTVRFDGLPTLQGTLAVYPHTSNWDFVILILVKWAIGIPVRFWGKDKLFRIPLFGAWLLWIGGVPVERTSPHGAVGQMVEQLAQARAQGQYFWLALAPEGTRKLIPGWRSGFYQATLQAGVPLGLVRFDYRLREVAVMDFITLTGDETADFKRIASVYEGVVGCKPGNASPIRLIGPEVSRAETIVK